MEASQLQVPLSTTDAVVTEKNVSFCCGRTLGPWLPYLYLLVGDEKGMPLEAQTGPARLGTKADTAGS